MKELLFQPLNLILVVLLAIIILILILYYTSKKQVYKPLENVFIHFLFYFIAQCYPFASWHFLGVADMNSTAKSNLIRIGFYGFWVLLCNSWFRKFWINLLILFEDPFLALFLLLAVLSSFWSETPLATLKTSLVMVVVACLAAQVAKKYNWQKLFAIMRWNTAIIGILSVVVSLGMPSVGKIGATAWNGVMGSGKALAPVMAINATLWYMQSTYQPSSAWMSLAISVSSYPILDRAESKAAVFVIFILIFFSSMIRTVKSFNFREALAITIIMIILTIVVTIVVLDNLEKIVTSMGKDMTFTGRTIIWAMLMEKIKKRPILGYGYGGFWQPSRGTDNPAVDILLPGVHISGAHNGFFEVVLQLGLVGLILLFLSYCRTIVLAVKYMTSSKLNESIVPIVIWIFLIISNLAETEYYGFLGPHRIGFLYCLIVCRLSIDTRQKLPDS